MIHVLPGVEPSGASLKDFATFAFPEDFERHEIQKPSNAAFSCGARSPFKLKGRDYLRSMLSRRQLQGFVKRRRLRHLRG
jgi:hypothetical protein